MSSDRYGIVLSTSLPKARDAYIEGSDLLLTLYPGAVAAFDQAIAAIGIDDAIRAPEFVAGETQNVIVGIDQGRQLASSIMGHLLLDDRPAGVHV